MDIQTLKITLTEIVLDIKKPSIIKEIISLIQSKDSLSQNQKEAINEALYALQSGEGIPHDVVAEDTKVRYCKCFC